jgi:hypothetical protein
VRPQLFSLVAFTIVLTCLIRARRGDQYWLLPLPPLFAVWANLHGGWLVGGGIFALWTAVTAFAGNRRHALWCTVIGGASLAATLLNPYGLELLTLLRDSVGVERADIVEWQPVYVLGWQSWVPWLVTAVVGLIGIMVRDRERRGPERIACLIALAVMSIMVARLQAFFALGVLFLVGPAVTRAYQAARAIAVTPVERPSSRVMATVALAITAAALIIATTNLTHLRIDPRWTPEPGAVSFSERTTSRPTGVDLVRLGRLRALAPRASDAHLDGWPSRNGVLTGSAGSSSAVLFRCSGRIVAADGSCSGLRLDSANAPRRSTPRRRRVAPTVRRRAVGRFRTCGVTRSDCSRGARCQLRG